jgi:hypothetical protein
VVHAIIPALGRLRQEDREFWARYLGPVSKKKKKKKPLE